MQITPRQSRVGPPSFRRPASTAKAEKYRRQARDIAFVGNVAGQLISMTDKMVEARAQDQYATAITNATEELNNLELKYAQDPDYATHTERYQQDTEGIRSDILETLENDRAQKYFNDWWDAHEESYRIGIAKNAFLAEARHMRYRLEKVNLPKAAQGNNSEGQAEVAVKSLIAGAYAAGHLAQEEREQLQDYWLHQIDVNEVTKTTQDLLYNEGVESAQKFLAADNKLYPEERKSLATEIDARAKALDADARKKREIEIEAIHEDLVHKYYDYDGNKISASDLIEHIKASDLPATDKKSWIDKVLKGIEEPKEEKSRYEVTDPEIEAKVLTYTNRKDKTPDEKELYIMKRLGKGLSNDDVNKYLAKIGKEGVAKAGKTANELTDPDLYMATLKKIVDPKVTLEEVNRDIRENLGADESGNPGLSAESGERLMSWNKEHKKDPVRKQGLQLFTDAYKKGYLDSNELADITEDWQLQIETGDYTAENKIKLAEQMIDKLNEEYLEDRMRGWSKKKEAEEYRAEIGRDLAVGRGELPGLDEYIKYVGSQPVKTGKDDEGNIIFSDGETGYRYNVGLERLEYYDMEKGKWRKVKRQR